MSITRRRGFPPFLVLIMISFLSTSLFAEDLKGRTWVYTQTSESSKSMTPAKALQMLKEGNARFVKAQTKNRNVLKQAKLTSNKGQYPFAIILSCIDSRGAPELIFDQAIGDIFSTRLAGNVSDVDQLGGIEYATKVVGSRLLVIMGHTQCGAVAGSCAGVELANLTQLLQKINPAVEDIKKAKDTNALNCEDNNIVDAIAKQNVHNVMNDIKNQSSIVRDLIKSGDLKVVGAMHNLKTGTVTFFEE